MHRLMELSRSAFLRLGATGVATAATGVLGAGAARGAPPPVTPQGDDVGFLAFGVVAERAALAFYRRALKAPGLFDAAERRQLVGARDAKVQHVTKINAALGSDAVGSHDFEFDLPKTAFSTRGRAVALGESLEELLVGVYLYGAGYAADQGTRLLVARLLTVDGQLLGALRAMAGKATAAGLPTPLDTEQAGDVLDKLLTVPGSPGGG
jgi:Ferritin-like domain